MIHYQCYKDETLLSTGNSIWEMTEYILKVGSKREESLNSVLILTFILYKYNFI